ncbi:MAG: hypothetical protein ABL984_16795 [Pyrinomonadaceae bacterium]
MADFNFYLNDMIAHHRGSENPDFRWWGRVCSILGKYLKEAGKGKFGTMEAYWCPDNWVPSATGPDVIVYIVPNTDYSVIGANGGDISLARSDTNLIGLTATVTNICEVYYDRAEVGGIVRPDVIAGAAMHEAAHVKTQKGQEMHSGQTGYFSASPSYWSSPSKGDIAFFGKIMGKTVSQNGGLKTKDW